MSKEQIKNSEDELLKKYLQQKAFSYGIKLTPDQIGRIMNSDFIKQGELRNPDFQGWKVRNAAEMLKDAIKTEIETRWKASRIKFIAFGFCLLSLPFLISYFLGLL